LILIPPPRALKTGDLFKLVAPCPNNPLYFEQGSLILHNSFYMSIAERKAKEKEELRDLILQASQELFVEKGIEETTIRNIADKISYSVGTVYVYFKDKNAILHALHSLGFRQYAEKQLALQHIPDPMDRLIARGRAYIMFALENPDMYDLMFNLKAPLDFLKVMESEWVEGKTVIKRLRSTVEECMVHGYFKGKEIDSVSYLVWSTVHGLCALHLNGRVKAVGFGDSDHMLLKAFEDFASMLRVKMPSA
jgi:AcrR family transcriptional regulator